MIIIIIIIIITHRGFNCNWYRTSHNSSAKRRPLARYDFASPLRLPSSDRIELRINVWLEKYYIQDFADAAGKAFLFQHGIFIKLVLFLSATLKQTFICATFYLASYQILFIPVADLGCARLTIIRNNFCHCNFFFRVCCCLYIRAKMPRPTRNCRDADISLV